MNRRFFAASSRALLKLVALIQDGTVIQRILGHLSLPLNVPTMHRAVSK